jgi:6-phosphogluconolactonase (cycloisomerase 2 family)
MRHPFPILLLAVIVGVFTWNCSSSSTKKSGPVTPVSIAITDANRNMTVAAGSEDQLFATETNSDGSTTKLTAQDTSWSVTPQGLVAIGDLNANGADSPINNGLALGLQAGQPSVTVVDTNHITITATATLTVTSGAQLQSITVTDVDNGSAPSGSTDQFLATGNFVDGSGNESTKDVTTFVTWSSSMTQFATICNDQQPTQCSATATYGLAAAISPGQTTITAAMISGANTSVTPPTTTTLTGTETLTVVASALPISVSVAPQTQTIEASTSTGIPFTATVSNDSGSAGVKWTLASTGLNCSGTTTCGSLSASSSASGTPITYTAPPSAASTLTIKLTATSVTDSTKSNSATITVTPAISVSVAPGTANIAASNPTGVPFTAIVTNELNNAGVNWSLSSTGLTCPGTTTCGSLSTSSSLSGTPITYTAPSAAATPFTVTLTATSAADLSKSSAATITITPPISVNVLPSTASIAAGSTTGTPFTATVTNDANNGGVNWVLSTIGGPCSAATCGALSAASSASGTPVTYTAPASAAATFTVTLTATSATDTTKTGFATITITSSQAQNNFLRYVFEASTLPPSGLSISSFAVWPSTGQLRSLTYFVPSGLGGGGITGPPPGVAIHPNGTVLYVMAPSISNAQIWTLNLGQNGVLQQTASSPITINTAFQGLAMDPLGQFLYSVDQFGGSIGVFALDQNGNPGSPTSVATGLTNPTEMAIDSTGAFLFVLNGGSPPGMINMYAINRSTTGVPGALTLVGTPATGGSDDQSMTLTPNGQFLYVFSLNSIYVYNVTSTGLTPVTGSPFTGVLGTGNNAGQGTVDPTGKYLYVTAQGHDAIYGFSIGASGAPAALASSPFVAGSFPDQINIDPSGSFVYVANREDAWVYSLNSSTGALTATSQNRTMGFGIAGQLLSSGSSALTFTPKALYVTNTGSNNVSQFTITPSTGALTAGSPVAAGTAPKGVAVLPDGDFAYVANSAIASGVPTLSAYGISSGVLSPSGTPTPTGNGPTWLTPDLSGTWMYNVNQTDSTVWKFNINSSGALTSGAKTVTTGAGPVFITTDPTGQYLYTANSTANTVGEYSIQFPLGSLQTLSTGINSEGIGPNWIAVDPSGQYAYVANLTDGTLGEFTITEGSGDLVVNGPQPFLPVGSALSSVVVEPSGRYVFVSDFVENKIFSYTINPAVGDLAFNTTGEPVASSGTGPVALAVDISGQYLYCVNAGSNDITIFKINLTNGTLTQVGTATVPTGGTTPAGIAVTGTVN